MNLALVVLASLAAAAAAWSWTPGSFRGVRVWNKNKRNLASFKNKFGYRDDREKRVQQKQREVHITAAAAADRKLVHRGTDNAI